jgi:hypothetical protein
MASFETVYFRLESILAIHKQMSKRVKAHAREMKKLNKNLVLLFSVVVQLERLVRPVNPKS